MNIQTVVWKDIQHHQSSGQFKSVKQFPSLLEWQLSKQKKGNKYWQGCGEDGSLHTVDGKWYVVKWYSKSLNTRNSIPICYNNLIPMCGNDTSTFAAHQWRNGQPKDLSMN